MRSRINDVRNVGREAFCSRMPRNMEASRHCHFFGPITYGNGDEPVLNGGVPYRRKESIIKGVEHDIIIFGPRSFYG